MSQDAREHARHISEVTKAYAEGKEIQTKAKDTSSWRDLGGFAPSWDWISCDYRVKPEERKPIKLTVEYDGDGQPIIHRWDQSLPIGLTHFIEVLPETETE